MDADRWGRVKAVFDEVVEDVGADGIDNEGLDTRLADLCGEDVALAGEVRQLVLAHYEAEESGELENSAFAISPHADESAPKTQSNLDRAGPYRIISEIGRGGMGRVYLAERDDGQFQQRVALKILRIDHDGSELLDRFLFEREILATLEHANIARLIDGGTTDDHRPYLAMEYVEGESITEYCTRRSLGTNERLLLFRTVCTAISYAHRKLIVHRDIKPNNILVTSEGVVKLLDFGIAKLLDESSLQLDAPQTKTGLRLMTPEYAAPEQIRGEPATTAGDIYQLGVLLYELLVGRRPYDLDGHTRHELERVILEAEPTRPSAAAASLEQDDGTPIPDRESLSKRLRGDLDTVILKALRKEPERRYLTADALSEDIQRHMNRMPVAARPDTVGYRTHRFLSRHWFGVTAGSAIAILLVLVAALAIRFAITTSEQAVIITEERDRAQSEADKAEQVSKFLEGMLESVDPEAGGGTNVTVRQVLDEAAMSIGDDFASRPELASTMFGVVGRSYQGLGLYDEADRYLTKSVLLGRRYFGQGNPGTAQSLNDLGLLKRLMDAPDSAEVLFREAIDALGDEADKDSYLHANMLNSLGMILDDLGRFAESDSVFQIALASAVRAGDDRLLASVYDNMGSSYQASGRFDLAQAAYDEGLSIARTIYVEDGARLSRFLNNIGALNYRMELYDRAGELYREALAIRQTVLGPEHPTTLITQNNLANLYRARGDLDQAEALFRETLEVRRRILSKGHSGLAYTLVPLGIVLTTSGRSVEGEGYLREGKTIFSNSFSNDHYLVAYAESELAAALTDQGRFDEAGSLLRHSIPILEESLGGEHNLTKAARKHADQLAQAQQSVMTQ